MKTYIAPNKELFNLIIKQLSGVVFYRVDSDKNFIKTKPIYVKSLIDKKLIEEI